MRYSRCFPCPIFPAFPLSPPPPLPDQACLAEATAVLLQLICTVQLPCRGHSSSVAAQLPLPQLPQPQPGPAWPLSCDVLTLFGNYCHSFFGHWIHYILHTRALFSTKCVTHSIKYYCCTAWLSGCPASRLRQICIIVQNQDLQLKRFGRIVKSEH